MRQLKILVIGAHPDDCDISAGGVAALYKKARHSVTFVSMTNGDAGHFEIGGAPLAWRRRKESEAAAKVIGIEYVVLDNHDGELLPTLDRRREMIRLIRRLAPDVVMTHRPNDYHPDHRYTSQIVQDAAYMITVPNIVSDTPHLSSNPLIVYLEDSFQKPYPFRPDIVVDIGEVFETKVDMLHAHQSQMYEWLPYNRGALESVPHGDAERRAWLKDRLTARDSISQEKREAAARLYGNERAAALRHAEAFEVCEYGARPGEDDLKALFPFFD